MNRATSATGWARNPDGTLGWTWNPITGCLNHDNGLCKGGGFPCYAFKLAHGRLKQRYLANDNIAPLSEGREWIPMRDISDPFYPRFWEERLYELSPIAQTHKGIFVCDMSDLFGIGIPEEWTLAVLGQIRIHPEHRFYLLTKQPQNLIKFSPFPDNCWVGVTATKFEAVIEATKWLAGVKAHVKYLSLEPLLDWDLHEKNLMKRLLQYAEISWLIPGACTGTKAEMAELVQRYPALTLMPYGKIWTAQPPIAWLREIVEAADKAGIRVFLKDNLKPLCLLEQPFGGSFTDLKGKLRQEMPIDGV